MLFRSDRKSTRLNSSHTIISYAVFCLKKKNTDNSEPMETLAQTTLIAAPTTGSASSVRARLARTALRRPLALLRPRLLSFFFLLLGHPPKPTPFPPTTHSG